MISPEDQESQKDVKNLTDDEIQEVLDDALANPNPNETPEEYRRSQAIMGERMERKMTDNYNPSPPPTPKS